MLQSIVYKIIVKDCKDASKLKGESLAKKIAKKVAIQMLSDQQRLLYNTIAKHADKYPDGIPTVDIAYYTQLDTTCVSSQLGQIHKKSGLIENVGETRHRYWKIV
jgi:hypothetical protein